MEATDIDRLLAELRAGRTLRVPFSTKLFPDTRPSENLLRLGSNGQFELTTTFAEFAPGHGWSCDQTEVESHTEESVRSTLRFYDAKQIEKV